MTTTTATLRMLLIICISLGQIRLVTMQSVNVPVEGVYLITMVADPGGRAYMLLQLNGRDSGFVAYGVEDTVAGLVVAVYLKAGTRVSARYIGNTQGATSLGVAFASYKIGYYITQRCGGQSSHPPSVVKFDHRFLSSGDWYPNRYDILAQYMRGTMTGIYWLAVRADCGNGAVSLDVGPGLFTVFCDGDKAISASGAFYMPARKYFKIIYKSGTTLQGATSFSLAYLEGNQRKYIKYTDHIAFTAWTDRVGVQSRHERLSFNKAKVTNYGRLYTSGWRYWRIPAAGSYIVSMRGDPDGNTLKVILYKNNSKYLFAWYNENRTKSGQAGVFQFIKGDMLYMVNEYGRYVGKETFMSIALLWVASE